MSEKLIQDLDVLLDGERSAILSGTYDLLPEMVKRKEALIEAFGTGRQGPDHRRIARKVLRNQELLGAAIEGVKAATGQVSAIRNQADGFQIYDQAGARQQVGGRDNVIERKL